MAKAGRPKNGSAGLPDWFDIQKYSVVKDFKAGGWFQQLVSRMQFYQYAEHLHANGENLLSGLNEVFALIKESPVITRNRIFAALQKNIMMGGKETQHIDIGLGSALFALDQHLHGVKEVDLNQTTRLVMSLKKEWQLAIAAQISWGLLPPDQIPACYREIHFFMPWVDDFFPVLFDKWDAPLTAIDFTLPDEILMKDFAAYLKEKENGRGKIDSPFFKSPDFGSWYNSGVLAYVDLMLWEKATGEPLRWAAFADALNEIVNEPIGGESSLSKTTKAHAKKLMDIRTIRILQSQSLREESGAEREFEKLLVR